MSLESPRMWNCPATHSPGFQSCPDDFSEMIYCDALFCPGCPHFVLLGLYHSSALPLIHPVYSSPFRGAFTPCPARGSRDEVTERLSISAVERGTKAERQWVGVGKEQVGCWVQRLTWEVRVSGKKKNRSGEEGGEHATQREGLLSICPKPEHLGKTFLLHLSWMAELLDETLGMGACIAWEWAHPSFQVWIGWLTCSHVNVAQVWSDWDKMTKDTVVCKTSEIYCLRSNSDLVPILISSWKYYI